MKIVNITGGLGNQMFQYAFAMALQKKYPEEKVYVDIQHYHSVFFHHYKGINLHNGYEIETAFSKAKIPIASPLQLIRISYWIPNYVLSRIGRKLFPIRSTEYIPPYSMNYSFDEGAYNREGDCYYEGFWQSIKYFDSIRNDLRNIYSHPEPNEYNRQLIEKISKEDSVGIHVRRGDYLAETEFSGICSIDYYKKAISKIMENGKSYHFYIFSDDLNWCKENLPPLTQGCEMTFVNGNRGKDSCWDMFLMSYCKNLIIANSSFSWWAAFLARNAKMVCAPYPWITRNCIQDVYDSQWVKINIKQ